MNIIISSTNIVLSGSEQTKAAYTRGPSQPWIDRTMPGLANAVPIEAYSIISRRWIALSLLLSLQVFGSSADSF
jgi:hypothetical protein